MYRRGVFPTLIMVLTAVVVEIPLILVVGLFSFQYYQSGSTQLKFLGFNSPPFQPFVLNNAKLFQDRIVRANGRPTQGSSKSGRLELYSDLLDKNTEWDGRGSKFESRELSDDPGWDQAVISDSNALWLIGRLHQDTKSMWFNDVIKVEGSEFIPQQPMPHAQQRPMAFQQPIATGLWCEYVQSKAFVLGGRLSTIYSPVPGNRQLYQLVDGEWSLQGVIELLDAKREWKNSAGALILDPIPPPNKGWNMAIDGLLEVLPIGEEAHLFWRTPGRLLYRKGFTFEDADLSSALCTRSMNTTDELAPVSAERPSNLMGVTDDWLLVSDDMPDGTVWYPAVAGGEPAVIVVREKHAGYPTATALYLQNGRWTWSQSSTQELPFTSWTMNLGPLKDGSATYIAATTRSRRGGIYEVDPMGIRQTNMQYSLSPEGHTGYLVVGLALVLTVMAAVVLGLVVTLCMCRDGALHEFGDQLVELASIMERAIARAIDASLIFLVVAGVARFFAYQWNFDWRTTAEAMEARIFDHPSFTIGFRIATIALSCLVLLSVLYIYIQGRYMVTPGKWLCRLRTVQTTLRPIGFAKSLLRELLLFVDNAYLISWTPAILMIAFTNLRQRVGDRFADTIVVRSRSLRQP